MFLNLLTRTQKIKEHIKTKIGESIKYVNSDIKSFLIQILNKSLNKKCTK